MPGPRQQEAGRKVANTTHLGTSSEEASRFQDEGQADVQGLPGGRDPTSTFTRGSHTVPGPTQSLGLSTSLSEAPPLPSALRRDVAASSSKTKRVVASPSVPNKDGYVVDIITGQRVSVADLKARSPAAKRKPAKPQMSEEERVEAKRKAILRMWQGSSGTDTPDGDEQRVPEGKSTSKLAVRKLVPVGPGQWEMQGFQPDLQAVQQALPALQSRLTSGVNAEKAHERQLLQRLYATSRLHHLRKEGLVVTDLVGRPESTLYSSAVWKMSMRGKKELLPYHRFRQGDSVMLSRYDVPPVSLAEGTIEEAGEGGGVARGGAEGVVLQLKKEYLLVALEKVASDEMELILMDNKKATWRIDQSVKDTTTKRQLEAIENLGSYKEEKSPFEKLVRCIIVGTTSAEFMAQQPPPWVREEKWREDARSFLKLQEDLNPSQRRAIATAMVRTFTLWQGPPGTGKTRTLLALMDVLVRTNDEGSGRWGRMQTILACADTNAAVDNLVEGLIARGMEVVRVGNPAKVREHLRSYTLEAKAEKTPTGRRALAHRAAAQQMFDKVKALKQKYGRSISEGDGDLSMLDSKARRDWAMAERLMKSAMEQVLEDAQVVCATCAGAGDPILARSFRMVVIDEATQATEPATLVPLTKGAQCVIMAGDPKQLPPTIVSSTAYKYSLDVTLFDRISASGLEPLLLDTQYRMHPRIAHFPSHWFYQDRLKDGVKASAKPVPQGFPWPNDKCPVALVEVDKGLEEKASRASGNKPGSDGAVQGDASYRNPVEAEVALQVLYALLSGNDVESAAILTPYRGQVRTLEHLIRGSRLDQQFPGKQVTVSSVDGYQGREADVVVLTTVRCNAQGSIGFVADPRRLNVAITRPRRGLVIVGSPATLKSSPDWAAFLKWARKNKVMLRMEQLPAPTWDNSASVAHVSSDEEDLDELEVLHEAVGRRL